MLRRSRSVCTSTEGWTETTQINQLTRPRHTHPLQSEQSTAQKLGDFPAHLERPVLLLLHHHEGWVEESRAEWSGGEECGAAPVSPRSVTSALQHPLCNIWLHRDRNLKSITSKIFNFLEDHFVPGDSVLTTYSDRKKSVRPSPCPVHPPTPTPTPTRANPDAFVGRDDQGNLAILAPDGKEVRRRLQSTLPRFLTLANPPPPQGAHPGSTAGCQRSRRAAV